MLQKGKFFSCSKMIILGVFIIAFIGFSNDVKAQTAGEAIFENYKEYASIPQEMVYVHLNKSTYVIGEEIGYTAYLTNKASKKPSTLSANLYVTLSNDQDEIINEQLLKVENGIASNVIELNKKFKPGIYRIKAFTNWMLNFKEQNYFTAEIEIIKASTKNTSSEVTSATPDVQFMPEGGHLVHQVNNAVGILVKDYKGLGIPNLKGELIDKDGTIITSFELNDLGIGRFYLIPDVDQQYRARFSMDGNQMTFNLNHDIHTSGVALSVNNTGNKLMVNLMTNDLGFNKLKNKNFYLAIHNERGLIQQLITFKERKTISSVYSLTDFPAGVNVVTIFNDQFEPVLERLFFNKNDFKTATVKIHRVTPEMDSTIVSLSIPNVDPKLMNNLSVSVLPQRTKAYEKGHNIITNSYLKNYINGFIENPNYYFTADTRKLSYDLDNLLLTQGWNSYDWNYKFDTQNVAHIVERGLIFKAETPQEKNKKLAGYLVNLGLDKQPIIVKPDEDNVIVIQNAFLEENDYLTIAEFTKNSKIKMPRLQLETFPNQVPRLKNPVIEANPYLINYSSNPLENDDFISSSVTDLQKLDAIIITADGDRNKEREEQLRSGRFGDIKMITNEIREQYFTLEEYLMVRGGVIVGQSRGSVSFSTSRSVSTGGGVIPMGIFIDDAYMGTTLPRRFINMQNIDYIEVNKTGLGTQIGSGFRSSGGEIRIYTSPNDLDYSDNKPKGQSFNVPLKFSSNRKFYVPRYSDYTSAFYNEYGTIYWKPRITAGADGNFTLIMPKTFTPYTLFIEGIINDDTHVNDTIRIDTGLD